MRRTSVASSVPRCIWWAYTRITAQTPRKLASCAGLGLAAGQAEQPVLQRGVVCDRDRGSEYADRAPLLGVRADLLPDAFHELLWKRGVGVDHLRDVVRAQRAELIDLPEVVAGAGVTRRAVHGLIEVLECLCGGTCRLAGRQGRGPWGGGQQGALGILR